MRLTERGRENVCLCVFMYVCVGREGALFKTEAELEHDIHVPASAKGKGSE